MAISRRPKKKTNANKSEVDIDSLIEKGGDVPSEKEPNKKKAKKEQPVTLRIPVDTLEEIDNLVSASRIKMPRHTWLLTAIYEKIERDSSSS